MNKEKPKIKVNATFVPMSKDRQAQAVKILSEMLLVASGSSAPETAKNEGTK